MNRPVSRPGDTKAHLLADSDLYALCGRPAGRGARWKALEQAPPVKDRCRDCVIAGEHLPPPRPGVPIYPWNPRMP